MKASRLHTWYLYSKIFKFESTWIYSQKDLKHSCSLLFFMAQQKAIIPCRRFLGCICEWPTCTTGHLDFRILRSSKTWKIDRWVLTNVSEVKSYPSYPQTKIMVHLPKVFCLFLIFPFFFSCNKKLKLTLETLRHNAWASNQGAMMGFPPWIDGPHSGDSDRSSSRDV